MTKEVFAESVERIQKELKDLVITYYSDKDARTTYDGDKETTYHVNITAFADGGGFILTTDKEVEKCLKK